IFADEANAAVAHAEMAAADVPAGKEEIVNEQVRVVFPRVAGLRGRVERLASRSKGGKVPEPPRIIGPCGNGLSDENGIAGAVRGIAHPEAPDDSEEAVQDSLLPLHVSNIEPSAASRPATGKGPMSAPGTFVIGDGPLLAQGGRCFKNSIVR